MNAERVKDAIKAALSLSTLFSGDPEKVARDAREALADADKKWKERFGNDKPWPPSRDAVYEAVAEFEQQVQMVRARMN